MNYNSNQRSLSNRLEQHGPDVKFAYLGSIYALNSEDYPEKLVHFAHSLREVIDLLTKKSLALEDRKKKIDEKTRIQLLKTTFDPLGYHHSYDEFYAELVSYYNNLSDISHHSEKTTTEKCKNYLFEIESILELLTKPVSDILDITDEILSHIPSEENAKKLQEYLFLHSTQSVLIQKLSVDWLPFLQVTGFFKNPAPSKKQNETRTHPYWMPSHFLQKCTKKYPEKITEIILECKFDNVNNRNRTIFYDFLECASKLPAIHSNKVAKKAIDENWHDFISVNWFAEKYGSVMEKLYLHDEYELAKKFAFNLFKPIIYEEKYTDIFEGIDPIKKIKCPFDHYMFEQILEKTIPKLVQKNHFVVIEILISLLNQSLLPFDKYSVNWIFSIEDNRKNFTFFDMRRLFVYHLRDCLNFVGENHLSELKRVMKLLSDQEHTIFRRLELFVYSRYPDEFNDAIPKVLETFVDDEFIHEYYKLIKKTFASIPIENQNNIVELIDHGVNKDLYEKWVKSSDETQATEYNEKWKLEKLEPISEYLDKKHKLQYDQLLKKFGKPEHPGFLHALPEVQIGGPKSPSKIFDGKSIEDILRIIKIHEPESRILPHEDGILVSFENFVEANPLDFSSKCNELKDSEPFVLYSLFSGLNRAVKNNQELDWEKILDLVEPIVTSANNDPYLPKSFDPFGAVCDLIKVGLEKKNIPIGVKKKLWQLIEIIVEIGDRISVNEENYPSPERDSLNISINDINGNSFHILHRYVWWCFDNDEGKKIPQEVKTIYENYLNKNTPHTISRHATFGVYFTNFVYFDKLWTENILPKIQTDKKLIIAFWDAYINTAQPNRYAYGVLYDFYVRFATGNLVLQNTPIHDKTIEHVTIGYLNDVPKYDELFTEFYNHAECESVSKCGEHIGFLLRNSKADHQLKEKIEKLWSNDKFIKCCKLEYWFAKSPLTKQKSIQYLLNYLKNSPKKFNLTYFPLDEFQGYVSDYPDEIADCIILILDKLENDLISKEPLFTITKNLLKPNISKVNSKCKIIKNKMILLNHIEFRDL